jgi:hypothetical protein
MPSSIYQLQHTACGRCIKPWVLIHQVLKNRTTDAWQRALKEYFVRQGEEI